ncbi:MAG: TlpA family protein disulfide reductase [Clostridia bacterium]|jgi:thiol-disulfide isomerase/thioredoxin
MKRGLYALLTATVLALVLASCAKPEEPGNLGATEAQPPEQPQTQTQSEQVALKPSESAPWYAERMERLGFYVFPVPEPLPPLSVVTLDDKTVGVDLFEGKVTMLNFWATWCPPCRAEMPSMQILYDKTRDVAFDIMGVSVGEQKKTVTDFLAENPYTYPVFLDVTGAQSAPFAGRGIPTTFILDKQGRAIAGMVGSRMYDGPEVIDLFRELAEKLP